MDPRWGASGKRIEFTLDVKFLSDTLANQTVVNRMVKDNFGGTSSPVYELTSAPKLDCEVVLMKWQVMVEDIASIRDVMVQPLLDSTSWSMARPRPGPHTGML